MTILRMSDITRVRVTRVQQVSAMIRMPVIQVQKVGVTRICSIVNILDDITNDPAHSGSDNHVGQSKTALSAAKAMSNAMSKKIVAKPTQSRRPNTGPNSKQRSQIPVQAGRVGLDRGRPIQSSPTCHPRGKGIRFLFRFFNI